MILRTLFPKSVTSSAPSGVQANAATWRERNCADGIQVALIVQDQVMRVRELLALFAFDERGQLAGGIQFHNPVPDAMNEIDLSVGIHDDPGARMSPARR